MDRFTMRTRLVALGIILSACLMPFNWFGSLLLLVTWMIVTFTVEG